MKSLSILFTYLLVLPLFLVKAIDVREGKYKIINRHSGKVLGVVDDSTNNAANVHQWGDNGRTSQQWIITKEGNYYLIMNVNANKALDVNENSTQDGANVIIWPNHGNMNQRWTIEEVDNGYVIIVNVNSGKLLDVEMGSMDDGGNVLQWYNNNQDNQQWKLVFIEGQNNGQNQNNQQNVGTVEVIDDHNDSNIIEIIDNQEDNNVIEVIDDPDDNNVIEVVDDLEEFIQANNDKSSCSLAIIKQGYNCCSIDCDIIYSDDDGTWGLENGQWCGCTKSCRIYCYFRRL